MPSASFTYSPGSGRDSVDLTSWASDASFATTPVSGDQIEFADTLTVGADGVVSGANGNYTLRHVIAATGQVEAISYQVGTGTVATLSSPTAAATGQNTATGTVDTDTGSGDLYVLATTNATESAATIIASGLSQAVSATGTQNVSLSGLDAGTQYYLHYAQVTDSNNSNVESSTAITTDAEPVLASATFTYTRGNNYTTTTLVDPVEPYLFEDWSETPAGGEQLSTQTSAGTFDAAGNFETDVEAEIPVVYVELDGTTWAFTIDTTGLGETVDTTPADFQFAALADQARDVLVTSNAITILDVDSGADVPLTISGDATSEYSISRDGGQTWDPFASADTNVQLNDRIRLRHRTGNDYAESITTTIDIGSRVRNFVSTTLADTVAPTISLVGGNQTVVQGSTWSEPGYSATDNADGDVTLDVVVTGSVDTSNLGQYTLTYSVTDSSGNTAVTTRTVTVVEDVPDDQTAPVISLVGGNRTLTVGATWTDPGYTATDDTDGDITANVTVEGTVNTAEPGSYTLTYSVTDAAGNEGSTTRTVTVLPATQYSMDVLAPAKRTFTAGRMLSFASNEPLFIMQSGEVLDFDFDMTDWLAEQGGGIDAASHRITEIADGLEVLASGKVTNEDRVKVWLQANEVKDSESTLVQLKVSTTGYRTGVFQFRVIIINRMAA